MYGTRFIWVFGMFVIGLLIGGANCRVSTFERSRQKEEIWLFRAGAAEFERNESVRRQLLAC